MSENLQERSGKMSENLPMTSHSYTPVNDDGFDDYDDGGSNSIARGTRLKFTNNSEWLTKEGEAIPPDSEFIPINIIRVVQKWVGSQAETRKLAKDEPWPDVKKLNDAAPAHEYREVFGQRRGPFENAYVVYLLDHHAMRAFWFPTPTAGGFRAVRELKDRIRVARKFRGSNLYPLVKLTDAFFPTQYGGRRRPHFEVKDFIPIGPEETPIAAENPSPQLGHQPDEQQPQVENKPAAKPTVQTALDTFAGTADATKPDAKKADAKQSPASDDKLNDKIPL